MRAPGIQLTWFNNVEIYIVSRSSHLRIPFKHLFVVVDNTLRSMIAISVINISVDIVVVVHQLSSRKRKPRPAQTETATRAHSNRDRRAQFEK